jgi:hypothetical protein
MAYRRKQGIQRSATFVEDHRQSSGGGGSASPRATRFADDGRRPERSALGAQARTAALGGELPAFGDRVKAAPASAGATDPLQAHLSSNYRDPDISDSLIKVFANANASIS